MDITSLLQIIQVLLSPTKGILAADESVNTIQKRFEKIGLKSSPETDLAYRKMLFTTPGVEEFLSGIILYDETINQSIDGVSVPLYLESRGIVPGIKVDLGVEKAEEGLESLEARLGDYKNMGAKFTKWRTVTKVEEDLPEFLEENASVLARYAKIVQEAGLVPIIEPEVVRDGAYDLIKGAEVTLRTLKKVFQKIAEEEVALEGLILKTNMITCGEDNPHQATPEEVARSTIDVLMESVPQNLPGIVFLSGGQSPDEATENLAAIAKIGGPWQLSYSFARALEGEALETWGGKEENVKAAQKAFYERGKKVSLARQGKLS